MGHRLIISESSSYGGIRSFLLIESTCCVSALLFGRLILGPQAISSPSNNFYAIENVACFMGDNCCTNIALGNRAEKPYIGCHSHRLNLAVKVYMLSHEHLLNKVTNSYLTSYSLVES